MKRRRIAEGDPVNKQRWNLKARYDLTPEQVQSMKNEQGGRCGICNKDMGDNFRIDHNHKTGAIRGLLCHRCNLLIAGIEDQRFYERAVDYLMQSDCAEYGDLTNVIVISRKQLMGVENG